MCGVKLWRDRGGVVAVEFALLSPFFIIGLMAGIYSAVNSSILYKATASNCVAMAEAMALLDPPIILVCADAPGLMEWPF